jgi:epoxyqueuosine reductase
MGVIDLGNATRPTRNRVGGQDRDRAARFRDRFPPAAKRHVFLRQDVLQKLRDAPENPSRTEITDPAATTRFVKDWLIEAGADAVGIAAWDDRFTFTNAEDVQDHKFVIVFAMTMKYDVMVDIGPKSQDEVHRVYFSLDDMGVRLAQQIGAFGYGARMQPNEGDIPLPAYGYLAGLGELGKHGSLISPTLGSSFRLCAVTTDMPLVADGPQDYGIDEICSKCNVCERFCPGEAIKPDKKTVNGVTRWHVDTPACEPFFHKLYGCKICLMVCPFNARSMLKETFAPVAKDIRAAKNAAGLMKLIEERTDLHLEEFE